jgi:hypothetical protein
MRMITLSAFLLGVPSGASACDLDGFAGMHRFNPFARVHAPPSMEPMAPGPASSNSRPGDGASSGRPSRFEQIRPNRKDEGVSGEVERTPPVSSADGSAAI